jgi:hypothetical protein
MNDASIVRRTQGERTANLGDPVEWERRQSIRDQDR